MSSSKHGSLLATHSEFENSNNHWCSFVSCCLMNHQNNWNVQVKSYTFLERTYPKFVFSENFQNKNSHLPCQGTTIDGFQNWNVNFDPSGTPLVIFWRFSEKYEFSILKIPESKNISLSYVGSMTSIFKKLFL